MEQSKIVHIPLYQSLPIGQGISYHGIRIGCTEDKPRGSCTVLFKKGKILSAPLITIDSPYKQYGFEWGNQSDGSTYLAQCLLYNLYDNKEVPPYLAVCFRRDILSSMDFKEWYLAEETINGWINFLYDRIDGEQSGKSSGY